MFMTTPYGIFLKWGTLNVSFCLMFVQFHFYRIMTLILVVACLVNIFMVLLISALATIGATKPMFLDSGSPRGEGRGGSCMCGHGLLSLHSSYTKFK